MPGTHRGASTQHHNQQVWQNHDTNLQIEISRQEKS